ncbi:MAG TPA: hypothetical protein VKK31_13690 [Thermoanaerobaculia bacterium]|nr:hypothetical protein [Thermoanaerobaculia bacterium]
METEWAKEWPKCVLLLKLSLSYAATGRTHGCEKLTDRLEEWRTRMAGAPSLVQILLRELCHVSWLLGRGDLVAARHHAAQAERKAREVEILLQRQKFADARSQASGLRRRSEHLRSRVRELLARSNEVLLRARDLQERRAMLK